MTKEELKNKYSAFITEISEILGLGKPVDILKLCAATDLFFKPLEKRIAELEETIAYLKKGNETLDQCIEYWKQKADRLDKKISNLKITYRKQRNKRIDKLQKKNAEAKGIIKKLMEFAEIDNREYEEAYKEAKQFLKEE